MLHISAFKGNMCHSSFHVSAWDAGCTDSIDFSYTAILPVWTFNPHNPSDKQTTGEAVANHQPVSLKAVVIIEETAGVGGEKAGSLRAGLVGPEKRRNFFQTVETIVDVKRLAFLMGVSAMPVCLIL